MEEVHAYGFAYRYIMKHFIELCSLKIKLILKLEDIHKLFRLVSLKYFEQYIANVVNNNIFLINVYIK
jgi:hypothetical protein